MRLRRSSENAGRAGQEDSHRKTPWASTLLFRTVPEERHSIYDWQITLKPQLTPDAPETSEEGPFSPTNAGPFTAFTNPFASRDSRTPSSTISRPDFQQRSSQKSVSTYPHAPRERPSAMISPSPSLRSRRSDVSSQSSSMLPPMGFTSSHPQTYTTGLPSDLPSPASTSGYDTQFIEGWTSAQGRSSALSSHTRGSNSIASAVSPPAQIASTPPGPRETILDRAFQMRCIPGSERLEDEKISSIARFEALMREADERKRQKSISSAHDPGQSSTWDLDEESEESSGEEGDEEDDADELDMSDEEIEIPTPAQRALDYISGRRTPLPNSRPLSPTPTSPPIPFLNPQAMSAFHGHAPPPVSSAGAPSANRSEYRDAAAHPEQQTELPRAALPLDLNHHHPDPERRLLHVERRRQRQGEAKQLHEREAAQLLRVREAPQQHQLAPPGAEQHERLVQLRPRRQQARKQRVRRRRRRARLPHRLGHPCEAALRRAASEMPETSTADGGAALASSAARAASSDEACPDDDMTRPIQFLDRRGRGRT